MSLTYPIKLEPDDNGTLLVTCPTLPEVTTFGEDKAEARAMLSRRLRSAHGRWSGSSGAERQEQGFGANANIVRVALYRLLARENVTRAKLMRRLNWKRE